MWPAGVEIFDALPDHWIEPSQNDELTFKAAGIVLYGGINCSATALMVTHSPNYASKVPGLPSPA